MKILRNSRGIAIVLPLLGVAVASSAAAQTPAPSATVAPAPTTAPAPTAAPKPGATAKPAAAKAGDPKALFASGEKKFKAEDYAGALQDFEASNTAKSSPETERYIAQSHDKLGHFADAVAAYEKFINDAPAKSKDQVEEAKKRVETIKAMPGKVHVESVPAGATMTVDGQPSQTPPPTDLELPPGKHKIGLTADGYDPTEKEIDVAYASKQDVRVELVKKEAPPPPPPPPVAAVEPQPAQPAPPPPAEPRSKVPAYVTGAVAIVAAGVGTGFGIKALSQSNEFNDDPAKRTTKRADDGENNALVADMMFGIAITFGVTSAVLFFSSNDTKTASGKPRVAAAPKKKVTITPAPYVTPSGGGVGTVVRF